MENNNQDKQQEKLEQLKGKTWETIRVLLDAKDVFNYCKYFYEPPNREECELANSMIHIRIIRFALYKQTVIELAKLLSGSDNDKFRISKYIDALKPDGYYGELKFPMEKILQYEKNFSSVNNIISDVLTLRDKFYAHTERILTYANSMYYNDFYLFITPTSLEKLINILNSIFVDVFSHFFDSDLDLSLTSETDKITILSDVVAIRKLEKQKIMDEFKK